MNEESGSRSKAIPLNCPECKGLFRIETNVSADAAVVCPHCDAELNIERLLDDLPVANVTAASRHESPPPIVSTDKPASNRPSIAFDDQAFTIPKPLKTTRRSHSHSHSPRSSSNTSRTGNSSNVRSESFRKSGSALPDLVKIVLGGLMALPIAQLILWWVFALDPLGLAAPVASKVPLIVPPAWRPADE